MFNLNIDLLKPVLNGSIIVLGQGGMMAYQDGMPSRGEAKSLGVDFAVMASATIVNELLLNMVSLPSFLQSIKNTYGVDMLTVLLYVGVKFMLPQQYKGGVVKNLLLGVGTVLVSNYVETPLRPYAPSFLLPKV